MNRKIPQRLSRRIGMGVLGALALTTAVPQGQTSPQNEEQRLEAQNLLYNGLEPCRLLDTRKARDGSLMPGEIRAFDIVGRVDLTWQGGESAEGCGIPAFDEALLPVARGIVVQYMVKNAVAAGTLKIWASDRPEPRRATLSFGPRTLNVGYGVVTMLRQDFPGQDISISATSQADVVAEVVGYYSTMDRVAGTGDKAGTEVQPLTSIPDDLTVAGDIVLTNSQVGSKVIKGTAGNLTFQETGDQYGSVKMSLQNRYGVAGVLFEQSSAGALIDFVLQAGAFRRNLRLEGRGGATQFTSGAGPEFQFGNPGTVSGGPNLVVADSLAVFRRGPVQFANGTASAPGITWGDSDSDTGIFHPPSNSNTLAFTTAGSEKMRVDASGNVGIGTTTPNHKLRIAGGPNWTSNLWKGALELDSAAAIAWRTNGSNNRAGIGHTNGGLLFFRTASDPGTTGSAATYDLAINDSGNVGIGTTTPGGKLDVNGDIVVGATDAIRLYQDVDGGQIEVKRTDGGSGGVVLDVAANAGRLRVVDSAATVVAGINGDGTVYGTKLDASGEVLVGANDSIRLHQDADGGFVDVKRIDGVSVAKLAVQSSAGILFITNSSGSLVAGITGSNGAVFGTTKNFVVQDPQDADRLIRYTSIEGPEAAIYVRGQAQLSGGTACVTFPDHFSAMAVPASITVSLTPRSADSKGLAVVQVGGRTMKVVELWRGAGNYAFDYTVYAVRKGYEHQKVYLTKDEFQANFVSAKNPK
jgi:hypothetical protein